MRTAAGIVGDRNRAVLAPVAVGVNVTLMVHFPLAATEAPQVLV